MSTTPGPWEVGDADRNGQLTVRGEHYEVATCWHHCLGSIEQEMKANARLIAAAPDLLDAARSVLREFDENPTSLSALAAMNGLRAAIAKAESQP